MEMDPEYCHTEGIPIFSRRECLRLMCRTGAGLAATQVALKALDSFIPSAQARPLSKSLHQAMFFKRISHQRVQCELCPRTMIISAGKSCFCRTRKNIKGTLYALGFDKPCVVNFEPIERGPLYHFYPGNKTMSLGAAGCNLNCLYCQNYELAQRSPEEVKTIDLEPATAIRKGGIKSVTITYTDPACQPEYVIEIAKTAKKYNLPVILCTAGYINSKPLEHIISFVDAFAVTLKAITDEMYLKLTGVHLEPVLRTIKHIKKSGKWLEIVTLVVPGYNDDRKGIQTAAAWIRDNVGKDTPWHLSRFTPHYKLRKLPPTPRKTLEEAREEGLKAGLGYVYITNLAPHQGNHTYCPNCRKKIIERLGFRTKKINMKGGGCKFCGKKISGKWS